MCKDQQREFCELLISRRSSVSLLSFSKGLIKENSKPWNNHPSSELHTVNHTCFLYYISFKEVFFHVNDVEQTTGPALQKIL